MNVIMPTRKLYTVSEAAKEIGCSPDSVRRWCRDGLLPCIQYGRGRGQYRIRAEDLAAFVR